MYRRQDLLSGTRHHQHAQRRHHSGGSDSTDLEAADVSQEEGRRVRHHAAGKLVRKDPTPTSARHIG
jgi:hypothetical protein